MDQNRHCQWWKVPSGMGAGAAPKHLGGLGVLDFWLMGIALRVRWLWLQCAEPDRPWSSMPLSADWHTTAFSLASTQFFLGDGSSFKLWTDPWLNGECIGSFAPELLTTVTTRCQRQRTDAKGLTQNTWISDITGALMVPVLIQYLELHQSLQAIHLVV
jgi:hypothetical protein